MTFRISQTCSELSHCDQSNRTIIIALNVIPGNFFETIICEISQSLFANCSIAHLNVYTEFSVKAGTKVDSSVVEYSLNYCSDDETKSNRCRDFFIRKELKSIKDKLLKRSYVVDTA
jgi:hypothetical protein